MRKLAFILTFIMLSLVVAAQEPKYEEGIHLLRPDTGYISKDTTFPEYLSVEDIQFLSCTEVDYPLKVSLLCLNNNNFVDLETYKWTEDQNCYLSGYNLKNFPCKTMLIQSEYTVDDENFRMTKQVSVKKLTKVLDHILENQYNDGGWRESLSTAYGIYALSFYQEIFDYEIEEAMRWLKLNRNDDEKCWPKSPCDKKHTAHILALLTLSNYTDYYRILNDGENYMEKMHNFYEQGDRWTVSVSPLVPFTTLSIVSYADEILSENFTLTNSSWTDFYFTTEMGQRLVVVSTENIKARIINQEGDVLIDYQGDNLSYTQPGACWSINRKGEPCDLRTTLYNTVLDLPEERISAAKDYLVSEIENSTLVGKYVGDESDPIDTALFLYVTEDSHSSDDWMPKIVDWMTYHQNNEGSWGDGNISEKANPTAFSVISLLNFGYNRSSEQVEDAEAWASENEEDADANATIIQASLFSILKNNARPMVTTDPSVLTVTGPLTTIDVLNPTTFNLREVDYEFSDNLKDILSIEKKSEISSYSYRRLKVTKTGEQTANIYGYLIITNLDREVGKVPVIVSDFPMLNVTVAESQYVFGTKASVSLQATKSSHEFVCQVSWTDSDISTPGSFKISGQSSSFSVTFDKALTKEEVYRGTLECSNGGTSYEFPISVFFTRYSSQPLTIGDSTDVINSTSQDVFITIINNLDQDLRVDVKIDNLEDYFTFDPSITLDPSEERNFTIANIIPDGVNVTGNVGVTFTALEQTKEASFLVDVEYLAPGRFDLIKLIIILTFTTILIGGLGYLAYWKRDDIIKFANKLNVVKLKQKVQEEEKEISEIKEEERDLIIVNLFKIMRFQNKDDKEIRESLIKNFSRKEIIEALERSGNSLQGLDEEEPEQI